MVLEFWSRQKRIKNQFSILVSITVRCVHHRKSQVASASEIENTTPKTTPGPENQQNNYVRG
jgi:hypothetical protein